MEHYRFHITHKGHKMNWSCLYRIEIIHPGLKGFNAGRPTGVTTKSNFRGIERVLHTLG